METSYKKAVVILKWIFTVLLFIIFLFTVPFVLDDQPGFSFGISLLFYIFGMPGTIVFLILIPCIIIIYFFLWIRAFLQNRKKMNIIFLVLPLVIIAVDFILYYKTQEKINKPYLFKAENDYDTYYFRIDGTLKSDIWGNWTGTYIYQDYIMKGDTIILDTIYPHSHLESKRYLKTFGTNSDNFVSEVLIPLDNNGKPIDSLSKLFVWEDKTTSKLR